jgi:2-polyprenyl-6-methoxyphenol hydroxylase-like FAD-dependent oxidoreductase
VSARCDAIVIGAGVAGATAAILLARAGWSVAVVEKSVFPRRKVCGECIAATNLTLLDALGIGAEVAALAGPPLERVALYVGDETVIADLPPLRGKHPPWGRALGRDRLDALLLQRARDAGAAVWQPWTAKEIRRDGNGYACRIAASDTGEEAELRATVLIGANGSWDPAPYGTQRRPPARPSDLFAFKANFAEAALAPGLLPVLAFAGGYGGMVIADDGRLTLACCVRRDRLREWRAATPGAAGAAVQRLLEESCAGVRTALLGARREGAWLGVGPIRPGIRAAWDARTGFAIGNAAGEAHPILGEGISMAIQSAALLCRELGQRRAAALRGDHLPIARAYALAWRRQFRTRIRFAALLAQLAMHPRGGAWLLPLLRRWPPLLTAAARIGGKVRPLPDVAPHAEPGPAAAYNGS